MIFMAPLYFLEGVGEGCPGGGGGAVRGTRRRASVAVSAERLIDGRETRCKHWICVWLRGSSWVVGFLDSDGAGSARGRCGPASPRVGGGEGPQVWFFVEGLASGAGAPQKTPRTCSLRTP